MKSESPDIRFIEMMESLHRDIAKEVLGEEKYQSLMALFNELIEKIPAEIRQKDLMVKKHQLELEIVTAKMKLAELMLYAEENKINIGQNEFEPSSLSPQKRDGER